MFIRTMVLNIFASGHLVVTTRKIAMFATAYCLIKAHLIDIRCKVAEEIELYSELVN